MRGVCGCLRSVVGCFGRVSGCLVRAFIDMRTIPPILPIRTAALKVSSIIVVAHHQPFRAVTLVGVLVKDVAVLTITLSSNLVKPGTRRTVGRGRWPGGVCGVPGCVRGVGWSLGSMGGSVGGSLGGMGGSIGGSLGSMCGSVGTLKVPCFVVVSHYPRLRAVTLVRFPVQHVAILTVTFLSISVPYRARWASGIRRGRRDSN